MPMLECRVVRAKLMTIKAGNVRLARILIVQPPSARPGLATARTILPPVWPGLRHITA